MLPMKLRALSGKLLRPARPVVPLPMDGRSSSPRAQFRLKVTEDFSASVAFDRLLDPRDYDFGFDFNEDYVLTRRHGHVPPLPYLSVEDSPEGLQAYFDYHFEVQKPDEDIDLLKCALLIAKHAYPKLDMNACYKRIDVLAQAVCGNNHFATIEGTAALSERRFLIQNINHMMFTVMGYSGNTEDYYDPDNSCLNKVLESRQGTPALLALMYMEVAARCGLTLRPVFLPSHTFVKPATGRSNYLVDPFNSGQLCSCGLVESRISWNLGYTTPIRLEPSFIREPPVWPRKELLVRILNDLRESYWGPIMRGTMVQEDPAAVLVSLEHALMISRLLRLTDPSCATYLRDEGFILCALERSAEGRELLEDYMHANPRADDGDMVRRFLRELP